MTFTSAELDAAAIRLGLARLPMRCLVALFDIHIGVDSFAIEREIKSRGAHVAGIR